MRAVHMVGGCRNACLAAFFSIFSTTALAQIDYFSVSGSTTAGGRTMPLDHAGINRLNLKDGSHAIGVQSQSDLNVDLRPDGRQLDVFVHASVDHFQGRELVPRAGGDLHVDFDLTQDVQAFFSYAAFNSAANQGHAAAFSLQQGAGGSVQGLAWPLSGQTLALKAGHYRLSGQWLSAVDPSWGPGHATVANIETYNKLTLRVTPAVPETGSLAMLAAGLACVALVSRRPGAKRTA